MDFMKDIKEVVEIRKQLELNIREIEKKHGLSFVCPDPVSINVLTGEMEVHVYQGILKVADMAGACIVEDFCIGSVKVSAIIDGIKFFQLCSYCEGEESIKDIWNDLNFVAEVTDLRKRKGCNCQCQCMQK